MALITRNFDSSSFGDLEFKYNSIYNGLDYQTSNVLILENYDQEGKKRKQCILPSSSDIILNIDKQNITHVKLVFDGIVLVDEDITDFFSSIKFKTNNLLIYYNMIEVTTIDNNGNENTETYNFIINKFNEHSDEEYDLLKNESNSKDENIQELNNELFNKNQEIENLNSELESSLTRNTDLKNTLEEKELEIEQLNSEIEIFNSKVSKLQSDLYDSNKNIDSLINDNRILEEELKILQEQIVSSTGDSSDLAEKLARAREELRQLNEEILERIQKMEDKLDNTDDISKLNASEIEKLKQSLVDDIKDFLGKPRFGFIPLTLDKQSIAAEGEVLEDYNTGHLYMRQGDKLISKTLDNEESILDLKEFIDASWVGICLNAYNFEQFVDENEDYTINSDETFAPSNYKLDLCNLKFTYDPMLDYVIALRIPYGEIESVYFEDEFANKYDCTLVGKTTYDSCYKLSSMNISITKLHPVITFKKAGIVNIQYISIFKDKASELGIYAGLNGGNGNDGKDGFGGQPIPPSLIDKNTIVNNDNTFTIEKDHDILVKIPAGSLMEGKYTIIVRARNDVDEEITVSTVFDGNLWDKKNLTFKNVEYSAGGKTVYMDTTVPTFTTDDNYIRIHTENEDGFIVEYFLIKMVEYNEYKYYTKTQVDEKDIIYCGKTTNNDNNYTAKTNLITSLEDGLTVRVKWNADSTDNVYFQINNFGYFPVVNEKQKNQKKLYKDATYMLFFNSEKRNFLLLAKGGDGIPEEGIDITDTNLGEMDLYLSTTILQGKEVNTHCDLKVYKVIFLSENVGFYMTDKYDYGPSSSTDEYKVGQFDPNFEGIIDVSSGGIDVSSGKYSSTSLYNVCNRYAMSCSHRYSSNATNQKEEEINIFDYVNNTVKTYFEYPYTSIHYNSLCSPTPDGNYLLLTGSKKSSDVTRIYKVGLNDNTDLSLDDIDKNNDRFFITDLVGVIYNNKTTNPNLFKSLNGQTLDCDSLGINNMVQVKASNTFIINKNNHLYLAELKLNGSILGFDEIKDYGAIPGILATPYRVSMNEVVFSNGVNFIRIDMDGNGIRKGSNQYEHRMDYFNGFIYGVKSMGTHTKQIIKKPTVIYPKED